MFAIVGMSLMFRNTAQPWSFDELKAAIDAGKVTEVSVHNDVVSVKADGSKKYNYQTYVQQNVAEWNIYETEKQTVTNADGSTSEVEIKVLKGTVSFSAYIDNYNATNGDGADIKITFNDRNAGSIWSSIIPIIGFVLLVVLAIILFRSMGGVNKQAMNFGKSRANVQGNIKVRFTDVAGAEEEKEELKEIVEFLKSPQKFTAVGARIPRGVLLVGPPGTGKTLFAKAVAGEANVPFFSISGSDFVEMFVGVGASRVRDLFDTAKKNMPCIIFIDEIDAVGRQRGAGLGGGHDEREQTLNQLLVQMDGFATNDGIIVMAATNRADILDPALLRPGRFDRQIYVNVPDVRGREAIFKVHARNKPMAADVDFQTLARITSGFSGADIANLLNEAALLAAGKSRAVITMKDLEEAMIKVIAGPEKRSRVVSQYERKLTAFHEAGHAIAMYCLPTQDPVHMITIVPRGMAGGMTISLPQDDQSFVSKSEMFETIVGFLGGRVAEQLKLDDISTGASNDIQRATAIARDMVSKYAMSDKLGPVCYSSGNEVFIGRDYEKTKSYSESVAGRIDDEVQTILMQAYDKCTELLKAHDAQLDAVAAYLMAHNNMGRAQFEAVMEGKPVPDADVLPITSVEAIEEEPHPSEEE